MRRWLESLRLPWANLVRRWALTLTTVDLVARLIDSASVAVREWWPNTCRPSTLIEWGRTLTRPRRTGETETAYRRRLATWRREPVGTRGWVADEVERITGTPRVIDFPHDGLQVGRGQVGRHRVGRGPQVIIGAAPEHRTEIDEMVARGVPYDAGVKVVPPDTFDTWSRR